MSLDCEHTQWIAGPSGYAPQHWTCTGCNIKMTSGEMVLWERVMEIRAMLTQRDAASNGEKK